MMHIGLIDLGFTPEGIDLLTGKTDTFEVEFESLEAFEALNETDQAHIILMQCLTLENEEAAAHPTKDNATAETEPSEKETININPTAALDPTNLNYSQAQALACLVNILDGSQSPRDLLNSLHAWRHTETVKKLIDDLVNLRANVEAELSAAPDDEPLERPQLPYNARTTDRLIFYPVDGVRSGHREASLPKNTRVHAVQNLLGVVTLFAWVDHTEGPADYVHNHARLSDFRMDG